VSKPPTKSSWLTDKLASVALASGIGYVAAAYSVSRWLTRATPGKPCRTPAEQGLPWERLECRTADGFRLVGWAVTPPLPRATVLLCHGVRNNREQTLDRTFFLAAAGLRCVAFDHRAHGQSDGKRTSFGYHERLDVAAALDLVRRRWPHQPLVGLGISMGAAALCYAAPHARHCDALILESLYHDIATAFTNRVGAGYPAWFRRLSRGVAWMTERRLGVRLTRLTPAEHVGELAPAPVLLLTGAEDTAAPPEDARRLYDRCQGPRELWVVPGASHVDVCQKGGAAYQDRVLSFLDRWVRRAA
jgi:alpha-beta hydrolase superfamily lysophospholipase